MTNIIKSKLLFIVSSILLGALSEPIIAIAYSCIGTLMSNFKNSNIVSELFFCIFLVLCGLLCSFFSGLLKVDFSNKITMEIRKKIFYSILSQEIPEIKKNESGDLINLLTRKCDIWQVRFFDNLINLCQNIMQILIMAILLTFIHASLFLFILIFLIPLLINNILFPRKIQKEFDKYLLVEGKYITFITDCLTGFETIKINLCELRFYNKIKDILKRSLTKKNNTDKLGEISGFVANAGVTLSQFAGTVFGIFLLLKQQISFAEFLIVFQIATRLYEPFVGAINNVISISSSKQVINEVKEMLQKSNTIKQNESSSGRISSINLKKLSFSFDNATILNHIDYSFNSGTYLIIGESGSGKSTLANLLLKNLDNYRGNIFYNKKELKEMSHKEIYKKIGYMSQNSYLFNDSIKNNIDLNELKTEKDIQLLLEKFGMTKILKNRKNGVKEMLDENTQVSGGEKARLVFLRTLLNGEKDIYIFDEVLSSLDRENADIIEKLILSIKDKIVIHISHHTDQEKYTLYSHVIRLNKGKFEILK